MIPRLWAIVTGWDPVVGAHNAGVRDGRYCHRCSDELPARYGIHVYCIPPLLPLFAGAAATGAVAPPAITAPTDDFDYGAAALGAGITAAIALLIAAGTLRLRQRSRPCHP